MCTALSLKTKDHYFGRNLDIDCSYNEEVCIMPGGFPLDFRIMGKMHSHHAMIGMATVVEGIPLFYEAANEFGLSVAGLNFPGNAYYFPLEEGKDNVAPFEFIPWILGQCKNLKEARALLDRINIVDIAFNKNLPSSPLHWIIADSTGALVAESRKSGLYIHDNPVGVLTNNPPFEYHMENLKKYETLRSDNKEVFYEEKEEYSSYSQGMGAIGLPGDVSSVSRFVKAAFALKNSVCEDDELKSVGQFFHLLDSVAMVKGNCITDQGTLDITLYSACINTDKGIYYYTTYDNCQINCVDMHKTDLRGDVISRYSVKPGQNICYQN